MNMWKRIGLDPLRAFSASCKISSGEFGPSARKPCIQEIAEVKDLHWWKKHPPLEAKLTTTVQILESLGQNSFMIGKQSRSCFQFLVLMAVVALLQLGPRDSQDFGKISSVGHVSPWIALSPSSATHQFLGCFLGWPNLKEQTSPSLWQLPSLP